MASHSFLPAKCNDTTGSRIESKEEESAKMEQVVMEHCYKIPGLASLQLGAQQ